MGWGAGHAGPRSGNRCRWPPEGWSRARGCCSQTAFCFSPLMCRARELQVPGARPGQSHGACSEGTGAGVSAHVPPGRGMLRAGPTLLPACCLAYASSSFTWGGSCGSSHTAWRELASRAKEEAEAWGGQLTGPELVAGEPISVKPQAEVLPYSGGYWECCLLRWVTGSRLSEQAW